MPALIPIFTWVVANWGWISAVISVASMAYSIVQSQNMKRKMAAALAAIKEAGKRTDLRFDPVAATQYVYGRCRIGGTLAFANSAGSNGKYDGIYLNMIQLLTDHPIEGFEGIYLNEDLAVYPDGTINPKFISGSVTYFKAWQYDGTQTAPIGQMITRFGNDIDTTFKYTGISYMGLSYQFDPGNQVWPTGAPACTAVIKGKKDIWDPRKASASYSDNPALCIRDYLTNVLAIPSASLDEASFIHAANVCDEEVQLATGFTRTTFSTVSGSTVVTLDASDTTSLEGLYVGFPVTGSNIQENTTVAAINDYVDLPDSITLSQEAIVTQTNATLFFGGTLAKEKRYTCWTAFTSDIEPKEIINSMLTSCYGNLIYSNGKFSLLVGEWREPLITVTQDDLLSGIDVAINASQRTSYNSVKSTYVNPDDFYRAASSAPYVSDVFIAEDNGEEKIMELDYNSTPTHTGVQRLQKMALFDNRFDTTISFTGKLGLYRLSVGDTFYFDYPRLGFNNKIFEVGKMEIKYEDGTVNVEAKETDPSIFDWATTDELAYVRGKNASFNDPWNIAAPSSLTVTGGTEELVRMADGTILVRAKLVWDTPPQMVAGYKIEYKKSSDTEWKSAGQSAGYEINTGHIILSEQEVNYDFRIKSVSYLARCSDWLTVTNVYIEGKSTPPSAPTSFAGAATSVGAELHWNNDPDDIDYAYTIIKTGSMDGNPIAKVSGESTYIVLNTAVQTTIIEGSPVVNAGSPVALQVYAANIDTSGNQSAYASMSVIPSLPPGGYVDTNGSYIMDASKVFVKNADGVMTNPYEVIDGSPKLNETYIPSISADKITAGTIAASISIVSPTITGNGLFIDSFRGINYVDNNHVFTLNGGSANGVDKGSQIDLSGASSAYKGTVVIAAGDGNDSTQDMGTIILRTGAKFWDSGNGSYRNNDRMKISYNGAVTVSTMTATNCLRNVTVSGSAPTGGADGEIWIMI